ncbi:MAG: hypothetical protein SFU98_03520 [Leptospiraceae bacterium]|nr:hypothetical protein [Leptospiraceae bacterium]
MVIKSLEYPIYQRKRHGGLLGEVSKEKKIQSANFERSFEDYLKDIFNGETIQEGSLFSSTISERTKNNLRKF